MKLRYGVAGAVLILALVVGGIATAIGGGETGSDGPTDTATQSESFVGLTIPEATALAEDEGQPWRIGRQDDEAFVLTDDLVPGRVTFEIDDGTVTTQQQVDFGAQPFAVCSERLGWRACVVHDLQG